MEGVSPPYQCLRLSPILFYPILRQPHKGQALRCIFQQKPSRITNAYLTSRDYVVAGCGFPLDARGGHDSQQVLPLHLNLVLGAPSAAI